MNLSRIKQQFRWPSTSRATVRLLCLAILTVLIIVPLACKRGSKDADDDKATATGATSQPADAGRASEVTLTDEAIKRYGIKVEAVALHTLVPTFVVPARVAFNAYAIAHVGSPVTGRVAEAKAKIGDPVRKGDVLMIVESPDFGEAQSDYLQKRTAQSVAESAVEPAKQAYERGKTLYDQSKGIALADLQKRQADLTAAKGAAETARGAVVTAENRLRLLGMDEASVTQLQTSGKINPKFPLTAPISGTVTDRSVSLGELVAPDKASLVDLADTTTLWVFADVPEARLGDLAVGAKATVRLATATPTLVRGSISLIPASLDPNTRSAQVRIDVSTPPALMKPGMFARAEIEATTPTTQPAEPSLVVPETAVMTIDGVPTVFVPVEGKENKFAKRPVAVGDPVGGFVPVFSGLKAGEHVVTAGTFVLKAELAKGSGVPDSD